MNEAELAQRFTGSFQLHEVMHPEEYKGFAAPTAARNPYDAAVGILQAQAASRVESEVEYFLNQEPGRDLFDQEENVSLALALFITARTMASHVQMHNGQTAIGDLDKDITEIRIEVAAARGDFSIDFLITWDEVGPHPEWYVGCDDTVPHTLEVRKELVLVRNDPSGGPSPSDRKTRRGGLASLGLLVVDFERQDAERDPFGLAKRALGDLRVAVYEQYVD